MRVTVEKNGANVIEEFLFPGRYFGEMSVITEDVRLFSFNATF